MDYRSIKGYDFVKQEPLPDIGAQGVLLRHHSSGARIILVPCQDNNKVFSIGFRTQPADSTGVAHIIEHSVLCGSHRFPLKDPFVELLTGSLNTFLNAITFPDKTIYPVASTNQVDFRNLMDVYLDAVLHPNIYENDKIFKQEGWSYRLDSPDAPLVCNGVVYNEMKGAFSSPDDVVARETTASLFPDTPYGVESGGDPQDIPTLTYQAFLAFHKRYYHPSNSYIYLYGDMDMAATLAWMDERYLSAYTAIDVASSLPLQKPFAAPVERTISYPVGPDDSLQDNTYLNWSVVAGNYADVQQVLALGILAGVLVDAPGAPLKQALLDGHIGKDIYDGFSDGVLQPFFGLTAKNANASDLPRFKQIIVSTLTALVTKGLNRDSLAGAINRAEFAFRQADYGRAPKGLIYDMLVMQSWLYDSANPTAYLHQLEAYANLRKLAKTGYFEELINKLLISNTHQAFLVAVPDSGLTERRQRQDEQRLAALKAAMSQAQIEQLIAETRELAAYQQSGNSPEALAMIPRLRRSDIDRQAASMANEVSTLDVKGRAITVLSHPAAANGLCYLDLLFDARHVASTDIPYLGLLTEMLGYVDTDRHGYAGLYDAINIATGGIDAHLDIYPDPNDRDGYQAYLAVTVKSLVSQLPQACQLASEIMTGSRFDDVKRIHEIIAQAKSQMEMRMADAGNAFAIQRAGAYGSSRMALGDATNGIDYYRFIKGLEAGDSVQDATLTHTLARLASSLFTMDNVMVNFTCQPEDRQKVLANLPGLLGLLNSQPQDAAVRLAPLGQRNEGFKTAGTIQYVATAGAYKLPFTGALDILSSMLTLGYLWNNLRVQGGAYGCEARFSRTGLGCFSTYRDPHLARSLDVYRGIPAYLRSFTADEATMTKYVIGTISTLDTPMTPFMYSQWCLSNYLTGVSQADLQKERDEILAAQPVDIQAMAPYVENVLADGDICVIGSAAAIEKDRARLTKVDNLL